MIGCQNEIFDLDINMKHRSDFTKNIWVIYYTRTCSHRHYEYAPVSLDEVAKTDMLLGKEVVLHFVSIALEDSFVRSGQLFHKYSFWWLNCSRIFGHCFSLCTFIIWLAILLTKCVLYIEKVAISISFGKRDYCQF